MSRGGGYGSRVVVRTNFGRNKTSPAFPTTYFCKMPFYQTSISSTSLSFSLRSYNINDIFSVQSGADVLYASNLNILYTNYVVLGFKWRIQFVNLIPDQAVTHLILPWGSQGQDPSSLANMEYQPGCMTSMVSSNESGGNLLTRSGYVRVSSIVGVDVSKEKDYWGEGSTSPAQLVKFYWAVFNSFGTTEDWNTRMHFQFYVKWFNPRNIAAPATSDAILLALKTHERLVVPVSDVPLIRPVLKRRNAVVLTQPIEEKEEVVDVSMLEPTGLCNECLCDLIDKA